MPGLMRLHKGYVAFLVCSCVASKMGENNVGLLGCESGSGLEVQSADVLDSG